MSNLSDYYSNNQDVNPYTMEAWNKSSRITFIQEFIKANTPENGKVLDVGCGDMYLANLMPEYQWTGLDINTQVNNSKAIKHDIEETPYPLNDVYDTVVCSEVLEHCFDPLKITKEIHRLLKPSGRYILSTPNFDWLQNYVDKFENIIFDINKSWTKEHIHQYSLGSHDQILEKSGFKRLYYTGADAHYGTIFHEASNQLFRWLLANHEKDLDKAEILAYKLLGEMFKETSHTIVILAEKK